MCMFMWNRIKSASLRKALLRVFFRFKSISTLFLKLSMIMLDDNGKIKE